MLNESVASLELILGDEKNLSNALGPKRFHDRSPPQRTVHKEEKDLYSSTTETLLTIQE